MIFEEDLSDEGMKLKDDASPGKVEKVLKFLEDEDDNEGDGANGNGLLLREEEEGFQIIDEAIED